MCETNKQLSAWVSNLSWAGIQWMLYNAIFSAARQEYDGDIESKAWLDSQECKDLCAEADLSVDVAALRRFVKWASDAGHGKALDNILIGGNCVRLNRLQKRMRREEREKKCTT